MAAYQQLSSGKWQARVRLKGHHKSEVFPTKKQAEAWAKREENRIGSIEAGIPAEDAKRLTLGDLFKEYITHEGRHHKGADVEVYQLDKVPESLKRLRVMTMTVNPFNDWFKQLEAEGLKPATVIRKHQLLRAIVNWGIKHIDGLRGTANVLTLAKLPRMNKDNYRDRIAQDDELALIVKHTTSKTLPTFLALALETAARREELAGLRWADMDLKKGLARVRDTKNGEDRNLLLSEEAIQTLKNIPRKEGNEFVFPGRIEGEHIRPDAITHAFTRAKQNIKKATGKTLDLRLHDIRHTSATAWSEKFDVFTLQKITGHKDFDSLKRYVNKEDAQIAKAMKGLRRRAVDN